ncbi:HNH/ENDO VII family nuclease [Oceanobacillus kimchii]|uniref:HNH/ENDO VII family nuclease n=1 Tax=Oceanobacillus kimchii TaxID=746691 RepID=UPI001FCB1505|nr:HNH/ENDO VII family nuclease [Oceanobacillus kimchii]
MEEDKSLWDDTLALSKKVADGKVEIGRSVVETTVNTGKIMWDGAVNFGKASFDVAAWAGEKTFQGGKAAVDFLFLDDVKTLVDDEATVGEKAMAGFFLLPIGKFGKAGKLVKEYNGFKVTSKGEVPAKKSGNSNNTGKDYKNYKDVEYTGTTKVNREIRDTSRRVYQRLDIVYERIDPKTGKSNYQLMKKGRPSIWKDGTKIELHHLIQKEPGSMVEIPSSMHKEYDRILHGLVENGGSFRNDPALKKQYENFRSKYWRWRANQIDNGDF